MACETCTKEFHPAFIILAVLAWIIIICSVIKILWMIGFTILFWIGVACLILKCCHSAGEADSWYQSIKKG